MRLFATLSILASLLASVTSAPAGIVIENRISIAEAQGRTILGLLSGLAGPSGDASMRCQDPGHACNVFNEFCCPGSFCLYWSIIAGNCVSTLTSKADTALPPSFRVEQDALNGGRAEI